jgi:hypothetical protein
MTFKKTRTDQLIWKGIPGVFLDQDSVTGLRVVDEGTRPTTVSAEAKLVADISPIRFNKFNPMEHFHELLLSSIPDEFDKGIKSLEKFLSSRFLALSRAQYTVGTLGSAALIDPEVVRLIDGGLKVTLIGIYTLGCDTPHNSRLLDFYGKAILCGATSIRLREILPDMHQGIPDFFLEIVDAKTYFPKCPKHAQEYVRPVNNSDGLDMQAVERYVATVIPLLVDGRYDHGGKVGEYMGNQYVYEHLPPAIREQFTHFSDPSFENPALHGKRLFDSGAFDWMDFIGSSINRDIVQTPKMLSLLMGSIREGGSIVFITGRPSDETKFLDQFCVSWESNDRVIALLESRGMTNYRHCSVGDIMRFPRHDCVTWVRQLLMSHEAFTQTLLEHLTIWVVYKPYVDNSPDSIVVLHNLEARLHLTPELRFDTPHEQFFDVSHPDQMIMRLCSPYHAALTAGRSSSITGSSVVCRAFTRCVYHELHTRDENAYSYAYFRSLQFPDEDSSDVPSDEDNDAPTEAFLCDDDGFSINSHDPNSDDDLINAMHGLHSDGWYHGEIIDRIEKEEARFANVEADGDVGESLEFKQELAPIPEYCIGDTDVPTETEMRVIDSCSAHMETVVQAIHTRRPPVAYGEDYMLPVLNDTFFPQAGFSYPSDAVHNIYF